MTPAQIEQLLPWSPARITPTAKGPRLVRAAKDTPEFSALWNRRSDELYRAGLVRKRRGKTELFDVLWYQYVPAEMLQARQSAIAASLAHDAEIELPCRPGLEYRGYQRAGVKRMLELMASAVPSALLADDMGLGKTPQAIGLINATPGIQRVLIIPPAKLKQNWAVELARWLTRKMSVGIVESGCFPSTDIVICNFEMIHKFTKSLSFYWDLIVIDEAHRLKDPKSIRAKHIFGCRSRKPAERMSPIPTRRKLALTGTPVPNKVMEIFPILNWLDPEKWSDSFKFGLRYADGQKTRFGWRFDGGSHEEELNEELRATRMIRRLKSEVLTELPPKTRVIVELENKGIGIDQAEWIRALSKLKRKNDAEIANLTPDQFLNAAALLEDDFQIAFNEMSEFRHKCALAKVDPFIEDVLELMEEVQKVIIFGHHIDCMDRIKAALKELNPATLYGNTRDPQGAVNRFQNDPGCRAIIGGDSMMEGHTLTAASTVLFFEGDWVPGKLSQKEDRANRFGQKNNVFCRYYVLKNSIDARMIKRALDKQAIIDKVLDSEGASRTLTPADGPLIPAAREEEPGPVQALQPWGKPAQLALF